MQRTLGSLRTPPDPTILLRAGARLVKLLGEHGRSVEGASAFEVGTGRKIDLPLALYLCGAREVHTYDLHQYLKSELVLWALDSMRPRKDEVVKIFEGLAPAADVERRLEALLEATTLESVLEIAAIRYHAPADAATTALADGSIDIHLSYTVFEHIPGPVLVEILREAGRLLSPDGLALHHIDPSDHFSHDDDSISMTNFLQFTDREWDRLADNQFAYHNRLRVDDFYKIYEDAGHEVVHSYEHLHEECLKEITSGFPLADRFKGIDPKRLATTKVGIVSRRRSADR